MNVNKHFFFRRMNKKLDIERKWKKNILITPLKAEIGMLIEKIKQYKWIFWV